MDRVEREHPIRLNHPPWSQILRETCYPLMLWWRARSYFNVTVFNWCPRSPRVRLLVPRTRRRTFEVAPCDTPIILDISCWENPTILKWNSNFNDYRPDICGMITSLVICMQRQLTAKRVQHKCSKLPLGQLGKWALPLIRADWHKPKVIVDYETLSEGCKRSLLYYKRLLLKLTYLHQRWDKNVALAW